MRKVSFVATAAILAVMMAFVCQAEAQRANVPGIIGGTIEGNPAGVAGSAMGYDYWGQSGFYPGSRGDIYGRQFGDPYGYYGDPYGRFGARSRYGYGPYRSPVTQYRDYSGQRRTSAYRGLPGNPPVDAEPYRAVIVNPEKNRATLRFSINGRMHELKPGEEQEFSGRMPREIRFDRGKGEDLARYSLSDGRYTFGISDKGWELYRHDLDQTEQQAEAQPAQGAQNPAPDEQASFEDDTAGPAIEDNESP